MNSEIKRLLRLSNIPGFKLLPKEEKTLEINIWSDIACPWCYVGEKILKQAIIKFNQKYCYFFYYINIISLNCKSFNCFFHHLI